MMKVLLGLVLVLACASNAVLQDKPISPRWAGDRDRCLKAGPCFIIWATNNEFDPVTIYVNGSRVDQLEGLTTEPRPIYIHESVLVHGRCAWVVVQSRLNNVSLTSREECIPPGGKFTLQVGAQWQLWWTPWQAWQQV